MRKFVKLNKLLRVPLWRRAVLRSGVAATIEHHALLCGFSFDVIVDVGANRGQFSLAARNWQPNARLYAFEPLATAADAYERVFAGEKNVTLFRSAVSRQRGAAEMQVSQREDSSSLLPISDLQTSHFQGTGLKSTTRVEVAPLVDFLTAADLAGAALLKIDVQGFELEVLKSAISLLNLFQVIYVEVSFVGLYQGQALAFQVIDFLREYGFVLTGMANLALDKDGVALQADMLFTPLATVSTAGS